VDNTLHDGQRSISEQVESIKKLAAVASRYPYYKYNSMWTRDMQNAVGSMTDVTESPLLTDNSVLQSSSANGSIACTMVIMNGPANS
jgi:hypothetical protein